MILYFRRAYKGYAFVVPVMALYFMDLKAVSRYIPFYGRQFVNEEEDRAHHIYKFKDLFKCK